MLRTCAGLEPRPGIAGGIPATFHSGIRLEGGDESLGRTPNVTMLGHNTQHRFPGEMPTLGSETEKTRRTIASTAALSGQCG